ncbi:MAG: redoxin domain-containing protein [Candidatus Poseidoniia archaeon]|jgi:cytochrome c-type biogenesis protein|nr:redoxin domain-containing protein [Candidatus Poseidoniia archaeon]MDP6592238.1 redoxin domain-containing protein [Candidatus Poseidoniia archaeon]MDP7096456.1 redoxin domain-containing protein [Candidatus Poseidoniia archaeon]MDP7665310.1 redoxin domain-containing protein [Candidatus Poseidoniia archaeon]HJN32082.1 redoxin domain-containing protein [Candidatus Poseidoniia archaeon]|tara:strand:+ start:2356 stop:3780 length:1425 start_codon:yes stop_codon:yes gene_type:complete
MAQKTNWDSLVEDLDQKKDSLFENIGQSKGYNTILENKVLFSMGTAIILILAVVLYGMIGGDSDAPDFTLKDTEGKSFSLSDYEGEKVVVLDFMFSTCEPCEKFVKDALEPYSKKMNNNDVAIVSISVFDLDDESELRNYAKDYGWRHALGDSNGEIEIAYGVTGTPKLFIIDKDGQITYEAGGNTGKSVPRNSDEMDLEVNKALTGQGSLVKVKESSIYLFAVGAGVMVFFSPCSFPMLPGYMSFYLANKKQRTGKFDEQTAKETLPDGLATAAGLMGILLLIGILLIPFVNIIGGFIPVLELVVGFLILSMGTVMVMEYDSENIVRPFKNLMSAISSSQPMTMVKSGIEGSIKVITGKEFSFSDNADGTRTGLFWYGVAYGSAATGCVAPVVVGLLTASIGRGILTGLFVFLIFAATAGALMVAFTMMVAASESTIVDKLKASTRQIEMGGGVVMIIVGLYLMYYFLSTSVF